MKQMGVGINIHRQNVGVHINHCYQIRFESCMLRGTGCWPSAPGFGEVDKYHALRQQLVVLRSTDGGANWLVEEHPAGFPQYEPATLLHEGKLHFVTRDQTKVRAPKQMSW